LEKILPPHPYCVPEIQRIIKQAIKCDLSARFQTAQDFLTALANVSTPNWSPEGDVFTAKNWQGRDWRITSVKKRKGAEFRVEKSPLDLGNYRKCHSTADLNGAFKFVMAQKN
jgi:hypothetical protein